MSLLTPVKTLDLKLLEQVKQGFVPMPGGQTEPVAGASPMTAAMGAPMGGPPGGGAPPMDPAMMGGAGGGMPMDPAMMGGAGGGMPMDPATMGGAGGGMPMDPAMMGGGGAPPMDPAAAGGLPPELAGMQAGPDGMVTMPVSQLITLIGVLKGDKAEGGAAAPAEAKPKKPSSQQLLSEIHAAVTGQPPQMPAQGSSSGGSSSGSSSGGSSSGSDSSSSKQAALTMPPQLLAVLKRYVELLKGSRLKPLLETRLSAELTNSVKPLGKTDIARTAMENAVARHEAELFKSQLTRLGTGGAAVGGGAGIAKAVKGSGGSNKPAPQQPAKK